MKKIIKRTIGILLFSQIFPISFMIIGPSIDHNCTFITGYLSGLLLTGLLAIIFGFMTLINWCFE